jgi:hypothetical protein
MLPTLLPVTNHPTGATDLKATAQHHQAPTVGQSSLLDTSSGPCSPPVALSPPTNQPTRTADLKATSQQTYLLLSSHASCHGLPETSCETPGPHALVTFLPWPCTCAEPFTPQTLQWCLLHATGANKFTSQQRFKQPPWPHHSKLLRHAQQHTLVGPLSHCSSPTSTSRNFLLRSC